MRMPWHQSRRQVTRERYPEVRCAAANDDAAIAYMAMFVRDRLEEDVAIVDRYERKRGRSPLPESFQNVLNSPEYGSDTPRSGPERAQVLREYIDKKRAWFRAIEEHLVPGGELTSEEFFSMLVYAGHFTRHPHYLRAWSIINYLDRG